MAATTSLRKIARNLRRILYNGSEVKEKICNILYGSSANQMTFAAQLHKNISFSLMLCQGHLSH